MAARNGKRDHHSIAHAELFHFPPHFHYFTHEFMPHDVALFHRGHEAVIEVQIGPANRRRRNFDDGIALIENYGIRHINHLHMSFSIPTISFHRSPSCNSSSWRTRRGNWVLMFVHAFEVFLIRALRGHTSTRCFPVSRPTGPLS